VFVTLCFFFGAKRIIIDNKEVGIKKLRGDIKERKTKKKQICRCEKRNIFVVVSIMSIWT